MKEKIEELLRDGKEIVMVLTIGDRYEVKKELGVRDVSGYGFVSCDNSTVTLYFRDLIGEKYYQIVPYTQIAYLMYKE